MKEPEAYEIKLTVCQRFSESSVRYLEHLIHDWLVARGMVAWYQLVWMDKAPVWAARASEIYDEIKSISQQRMGRTRIKLHPF